MNKLITLVLAMGLLIWNPYPFKILELKTFDYLIMNTEPVQNENILIVDIDEETVSTYGGWPLPRSVYEPPRPADTPPKEGNRENQTVQTNNRKSIWPWLPTLR